MFDFQEVHLTSLDDVSWQRVVFIQVKRYEVTRRMEVAVAGPLKSLPILGTVQRFAIEAVHKDDTWDRVHWAGSLVEAQELANELADAHGLVVRVAL